MTRDDDPTPRSAADWAALLKSNWEERGRSPSRDFYVASHPGWNDDEAWGKQAVIDVVSFLHGLDPAWVAGGEILEVGSGVGRLAGLLRSRCLGYTGIDISEAMVDEARRRLEGTDGVRFLVGDGLSLPAEACDRRYRLALSLAVLIHCPREVIASLVAGTYAQLEPGGQLRFQLRADASDPEGIQPAPDIAHPDEALEQHARRAREIEATAARETDLSLITDRYYMGHAFRYAEAGPFLTEATGGEVTVLRFDPDHLYGWIRRV